MSLQIRLALEALRKQTGGRREVICVAQTVLLTSFLTEAGFGLLSLAFIREVEERVLELLDVGGATGDWTMSAALLEAVTTIINEHDRQLREVRFAAIVEATERLERLIAAAPATLSLRRPSPD